MADAEQEVLFLLGLLLCVVHYITSVRGTSACLRMDGCQMRMLTSATLQQEVLFLLGLLLCVVHYITSVRGTSACSWMDGCQMP